MAEKQTFRYGSKASAYQAIIQGAEPNYLPGTATMVGRTKEIVAEFGADVSGEYDVLDANGEPLIDDGTGMPVGRTSNIMGHYFDSRQQQAEKNWTDEEHDRVVARLDYLCRIRPEHVWKLEDAKLDAPLPGWNDLSSARKLAISAELGIVGNALQYERQEARDAELVGRLEKKLAAEDEAREQEEALVA